MALSYPVSSAVAITLMIGMMLMGNRDLSVGGVHCRARKVESTFEIRSGRLILNGKQIDVLPSSDSCPKRGGLTTSSEHTHTKW
jgi:hypothetical protein